MAPFNIQIFSIHLKRIKCLVHLNRWTVVFQASILYQAISNYRYYSNNSTYYLHETSNNRKNYNKYQKVAISGNTVRIIQALSIAISVT